MQVQILRLGRQVHREAGAVMLDSNSIIEIYSNELDLKQFMFALRIPASRADRLGDVTSRPVIGVSRLTPCLCDSLQILSPWKMVITNV